MTKVSEQFKETIKAYLDQRAKDDALFAESYKKEAKNIDGCIDYILNTVQKSGCNGFADDEIYSMAVHYYDEDNIKVGKLPANMKVVVNRQVELTEEEKEEAKKQAFEAEIARQREALTKRTKKSKEDKQVVQQGTLF